MRRASCFVWCTLIVSLTACSAGSNGSGAPGSGVSNDKEQAALMQASRDWAKAAAAGDVEKILSYWSDTAIVLEPGQPAHVGKAAIRKMVEGSMKVPKFSITWEPERAWVSLNGDVGYLIERNKVTFADSTGKLHTEYGKAVTVWTKDDNGNWKNVVDTWNANPTEKVFPGS